MADQSTNYICPACLGPLHFSSEAGKLVCDYCGSSYTVDEMEAINQQAINSQAPTQEEAEDALQSNGKTWGPDAENLRTYRCPSCSAQIICDQNTVATSCPYCGNPTIVPGQFQDDVRPDYVIPFKLTKKDAETALKNHYKNKFLLPDVFKTDSHIREVKGIYVPFWLFSGQVNGYISYTGTKVSSHISGNYRIVTTSYYDIERQGSMDFLKVPVDASKKMPDDMMESLEPYNYRELTRFTTAYLPGFFADKYDVTSEQAQERAKERCISSTADKMRSTVAGYSSVTTHNTRMKIRHPQIHYVFLPVWLLTTKWKDKTYLYAMNGQTGKLVGDLPIDQRKLNLVTLFAFFATLIPLALLAAPALGSLIISIFNIFFL